MVGVESTQFYIRTPNVFSHPFTNSKVLRWWKNELIQLIFHNYCNRKLMPHDTMLHSREEISEGTCDCKAFPFLSVCFDPNFRAVTIETTSVCQIGHWGQGKHVGGLGARQVSENIPQFDRDKAVGGKGDAHILCIHLISVHNLRGRV